MRADDGVGLARPRQRRAVGVGQANVLDPRRPLVGPFPLANLAGELRRPAPRQRVRPAAQAAQPLLQDGAVPDVVQVELAAAPADVDAVAAAGRVLVVQRLVQVADKVDDKLGRLRAAPGRQRRVVRLRRVVGQRRHDAAARLAVARQVHVARARRLVVRVDEVKRAGELAPFRVADGVGPAGDGREVVVVAALEEVLEVGLGRVGDEVAGNVGRGDVSKTCAGGLVDQEVEDTMDCFSATYFPMQILQAARGGRTPRQR